MAARGTTPGGDCRTRPVWDALALARAPGPRSILLDVGCGPACSRAPWRQHYDEVVGVDVDADMLTLAVETARERELLRVLPAPERGADRRPTRNLRPVTFALSFHWMDQPRVAQAVRSVLRRGGVCVHVFANTLRGTVGAGDPGPPYAAIDALRDRYWGRAGATTPAERTQPPRPTLCAMPGSRAPKSSPSRAAKNTSTVEDLVPARRCSTPRAGQRGHRPDGGVRARPASTVVGGQPRVERSPSRLFDARLDVGGHAAGRDVGCDAGTPHRLVRLAGDHEAHQRCPRGDLNPHALSGTSTSS